jgi:hypothetical protein
MVEPAQKARLFDRLANSDDFRIMEMKSRPELESVELKLLSVLDCKATRAKGGAPEHRRKLGFSAKVRQQGADPTPATKLHNLTHPSAFASDVPVRRNEYRAMSPSRV